LTKVVLLWRKTAGSRSRVWLKAAFSRAIAPNAVLALEIALERFSPRSATAVASLPELTTKPSKRRSSAVC
jgi:hypothetical protein